MRRLETATLGSLAVLLSSATAVAAPPKAKSLAIAEGETSQPQDVDANERCELAEVQSLERSLKRSIVRVHDGSDGYGFLVGNNRVLTSWSLLVLRRGPEVVLANGARYAATVIDTEGDIAVLELEEELSPATKPQVEPVALELGPDFLDAPPHLVTHFDGGVLRLAYVAGPQAPAPLLGGANRLPERGLPIVTCQGEVIGMTQSPFYRSFNPTGGPTRLERSQIASMLEGRPEPDVPSTTRFGFTYEGLNGLVDSRGMGGLGISVGPKWVFEDRVQLDLRADAFLLFSQYLIGGRFAARAAIGPRLRLGEGWYFVPQVGGSLAVVTSTTVPDETAEPGPECNDSQKCLRIHERMRAIEGEPALVPYGRVAIETGLAEGIIGAALFYELHIDPRDDSRTHQFGIGIHF